MTAPRDVMLWRLKPAGTCGVGDHTRGMVRNLGVTVRDFSRGERTLSPDTVVQWVPSGWTETLGAATPLLHAVQRSTSSHVLFMHELWRGPLLRRGPKSSAQMIHDLMAVRVLLPHMRRVLVTSGLRKDYLLEAAGRMGLRPDAGVVHVASNVHDGDPIGPIEPPANSPPTLVLFARAGGGVLAEALARTLVQVRQRRPSVKMVLLGARGDARTDAVTRALTDAGLWGELEVTGALPAAEVVRRLGGAHVGLSLHDTGVSGRRGTVAAMLATGVPVVTARGVETDAWWDGCKGVEMPTHADRVDAEALADGVLRLLDESPVVMRQRREAAHAFYLRYASWAALSRALG